jgi:tetratricopeptide (TPR) repeat protein
LRRNLWISLALLVATLAVYSPVHDFEFTNYDDPDYVTDNPQVRNALTSTGVVWAFTTSFAANWFPITWLSHMLDVQLFGLSSGMHHLTNVLLHAAASLLLFLLLLRSTGARWPSAFVAFVFALHPLHVESVAWVAERKDVLSALFWFATLLAYVHYVERPSASRYALVILLFCCGLMSKPMAVTLPFVALLLDWWPLRRLSRKSVMEKLPLFALSLAASVVTYIVQQRGGAVLSTDNIPLALRIGNAIVSYVVYLGEFFWPAKLAVFYPYPSELPLWQPIAATLLLAGITALALRRRYLTVGWLWYLGTLVPVIGIVQVGVQSHADRYTYIPAIGIAIMLAWGAEELVQRHLAAALGLVACLAMAVTTWLSIQHWRNSTALFEHALAVTSGNYVAHNNLGVALRRSGRIAEAIPQFQQAIEIKTRFPEAQNNLGEALLVEGRLDEAAPHIGEALRLQPSLAEAHINWGTVLLKRSQPAEAATAYRVALQLQPVSSSAQYGLGVALTEQNQFVEALPHLQEAVRIKPEDPDAHYNLGRLFGLMGRPSEAAAEFAQTVRLQPYNAEAHFNLGNALAGQEKFGEALEEFRTAVRLKPVYTRAHFNYGSALATLGRFDEAIREFSEALRLEPNFVEARQSLEACRALRAKS